MQDNLHNPNTLNSNLLPSLEEVRRNNINQQHNVDNELKKLPNDNEKNKKFNILDLNNIITIERLLEIALKIVIVVFIGIILWNQIVFFKNLILGVATGKYILDSTTLQIVSSALILEFLFAMKIVINSLFPESDRKNSLDFMKNKNSNSESKTPQSNNTSSE